MKYYCAICNGELKESHIKLPCSFCNTLEEADWICSNNHFQCEICRVAEPAEIILRVTNSTHSVNPFEIANLVMHHPTFRSHGIEHHQIVAPSVLTALSNAKAISVSKSRIKTALKRTQEIPYGTCGSRGDCGASIGAGVVMSIISRATYKSDKERSLVLKATGIALLDLAEKSGPRCCKQSVFSAIESILRFLNSEKIISFPIPDFRCEFKDMDGCKKELCSYYAI